MNPIEFPGGYRIGRETVHDWSQHLVITRERAEDREDVCVCWIGTVALITTDGGGWFPDEGAALGVLPDGTTWLEPEWNERFGESVRETEQPYPRLPLAKALPIARFLAEAATRWIPLVDRSFEVGDTLEQIEEATSDFMQSPAADDQAASLLATALVLLWLSEDARRRSEACEILPQESWVAESATTRPPHS